MSEAIRILLVDDSRTARDYYANLFKRNGYHARVASSVDNALRMLNEAHFDIAIIDYFMPGTNGDALCHAIRADARNNHMSIAVLTASYSDEVIRGSLAAGATDCLFKEEPVELLLARLTAMVRGVRGRKAADSERRHLAGILSTLSEGVYGVDVESRITFMNPAGLKILGYQSEAELIGLDPHTAFYYAQSDGRPNPVETCYLHQAYELGDALPIGRASSGHGKENRYGSSAVSRRFSMVACGAAPSWPFVTSRCCASISKTSIGRPTTTVLRDCRTGGTSWRPWCVNSIA